MSYKTALEKLKAHEPKRLAWHSYLRDGISCAIGAIAPSTHGAVGFIQYVLRDNARAALEIDALCMPPHEAELLQRINDNFIGSCEMNSVDSQEERYAHVLAFLEAEVAKESL